MIDDDAIATEGWLKNLWEASIRHPAFFHAQRLTPAYVRHANTTYATVTRQFLPVDFGGQSVATWERERLHAAIENGEWLTLGGTDKLVRTILRRGGSPS